MIQDEIKEKLLSIGIDQFGILPLTQCKTTDGRLAVDYYAEKNPERSNGFAVCFLIPYLDKGMLTAKRNVSLYACAKDYHLFLKSSMQKILPELREKHPDMEFEAFCDVSPFQEVDMAYQCRLGRMTEKGLLCNETYGTYVFIGELICLSAEPIDVPEVTVLAMPEHHLCEPCISAVTQDKHREKEQDLLLKKHKLIWGCDGCQSDPSEVSESPIPFFHQDLLPYLTTEILQNMSKTEFKERAYSWRPKSLLLRNLEIMNEDNTDLRR